MTKSLLLKNNNYLLDDDSNDENETVDWIEPIETKKYFDCGCCDECLCDDNKPCENCGCNCNGDDLDDELYDADYENNEESDYEDYTQSNKSNNQGNLSNFNINIIENQDKEKKVRITLELNVILDNKKNEVICIDLDINSSTYLKIAEELFKA